MPEVYSFDLNYWYLQFDSARIGYDTIQTYNVYTSGDVNMDGTVDVSDAVLLARFCAEDTAAVMTKEGLNAADCNADNLITNEDVIFILRIIAKLTVPE